MNRLDSGHRDTIFRISLCLIALTTLSLNLRAAVYKLRGSVSEARNFHLHNTSMQRHPSIADPVRLNLLIDFSSIEQSLKTGQLLPKAAIDALNLHDPDVRHALAILTNGPEGEMRLFHLSQALVNKINAEYPDQLDRQDPLIAKAHDLAQSLFDKIKSPQYVSASNLTRRSEFAERCLMDPAWALEHNESVIHLKSLKLQDIPVAKSGDELKGLLEQVWDKKWRQYELYGDVGFVRMAYATLWNSTDIDNFVISMVKLYPETAISLIAAALSHGEILPETAKPWIMALIKSQIKELPY